MDTNELHKEREEREKSDLISKIADLKQHIKQLTGVLEALRADIKEMQVLLERAGEDREKENKELPVSGKLGRCQ